MQPRLKTQPQLPTPLVTSQLALSALVVVLGDALDELKQPGAAFDRSDIVGRIEDVLASAEAVLQ
jgi:hypothetical protein